MNWKEFLKKDNRKILLFVILSIFIVLFMPIQEGYLFVDCFPVSIDCPTGGPTWTILIQEITDQILFGNSIFQEYPHYTVERNLKNFASKHLLRIIIQIGFALIISYLLSCLIIWIYDRSKKKK